MPSPDLTDTCRRQAVRLGQREKVVVPLDYHFSTLRSRIMPEKYENYRRRKPRVPSYRLHKSSGQATVRRAIRHNILDFRARDLAT